MWLPVGDGRRSGRHGKIDAGLDGCAVGSSKLERLQVPRLAKQVVDERSVCVVGVAGRICVVVIVRVCAADGAVVSGDVEGVCRPSQLPRRSVSVSAPEQVLVYARRDPALSAREGHAQRLHRRRVGLVGGEGHDEGQGVRRVHLGEGGGGACADGSAPSHHTGGGLPTPGRR